MKRLVQSIVFVMALTSLANSCHAQYVKKDVKGNFFPSRQQRAERADSAAGKTYTDNRGNVFPVYVSRTGKYYIIRISKASGNRYKYYLKVED